MVISGFSIGSPAGTNAAQKNAAVTGDFLSFMKETPAERLQDQWLRSHNLTKEKLAAMSPDGRAAVIRQMQDELKDKIKQQAETKNTDPRGSFVV